MQQLAEQEEIEHLSSGASERVQHLEAKVKLLEKDLFYYKKTSRELRKKLQRGRDDERREGAMKATASNNLKETVENDTVVADSLQTDHGDSLTVSGVSLASKGRGQKGVEHGVGDDRVGQAPPTSESQQQVVRKPKKQLRQLR